MAIEKEEVIEDIKANICEITAGLSVLTISLMLLFLRIRDLPAILIALMGCFSIIMIGIEKRAKTFDRIVSMLTILVLALGFMFLS